VTGFIRNARAGGCAAGTPPANLGFRLVRDRRGWGLLSAASPRGVDLRQLHRRISTGYRLSKINYRRRGPA